MKRFFLPLIVFGALAGLLAIGATTNSSDDTGSSNTAATSSSITIEEINSDVAEGALFMDVRTSEEYRQGHYSGAQLFPLQDIEAGLFPSVASDTKVYLYCQTGNRSAQATRLLQSAGFTNIVDLGGLDDVAQTGAELVSQ